MSASRRAKRAAIKTSRLWMALAGLLLLLLVLCGRCCISAMLSNAGMIKLNHALRTPGRIASPQQLQEAERWFTRSLAWDAANPAAHRGLGWTWEARGDSVRAAHWWKQGGFSAQDFLMCADAAASVAQEDLCRLWLRRAALMQP